MLEQERQKMQQPAPPPEQQGQPQGPGGQPPIDQDGYDIFVAQGIRLASQIDMQGKASVDLLGRTLFDVVSRVEAEGTKNGIKFDLAIVLHGSNEILGYMLQKAKVQIDEEQTKAVIGVAVGLWIQDALKSGKMTPEQLKSLADQGQQTMQQQGQGASQNELG